MEDKVNLKFNLPKISNPGNFVFVYSLGTYPDDYKTVKLDHKVDDGSKRSNVEYQSNIAAKINIKNRKWGW